MQCVPNMPPNAGPQGNPASFGEGSSSMSDSQNNSLRGLIELHTHCSTVYSNVTEPICFRTNKSLVLGEGNDPLDYVYIYKNEGDPELGILPHWHYVGFGLSDIYNYAMLCELDQSNRERSAEYNLSTPSLPQLYPKPGSIEPRISGFGFELTFRLACDSPESLEQQQPPPMWPCHIMRDLARYVFQSKNLFKVGDHVAWLCSLDGGESRIEHMLMTLDPELQEKETSLGWVKFIQIVGVCQEELQAAREFNVRGVLDIMKERIETGGKLLITDMRRGQTIFELDPENRDKINREISTYGSDMTLISALHKYSACIPKWYKEVEQSTLHDNNDSDDNEYNSLLPHIKTHIDHTIQGVERGNLLTMPRDDSHCSKSQDNHYNGSRVPSRMSLESESELVIEKSELLEVRAYDNLYLLLNLESAKVLPLALRGRLKHRKPFSYQAFSGELLTTFVPEGAAIECLVSREQPFARKGTWLQIYVPDELRRQMLKSFEEMPIENFTTDRNLSWPDYNFHITIVDEIREPMDMS